MAEWTCWSYHHFDHAAGEDNYGWIRIGGGCFRAAMAGKDARNAIYAERLKTSPHYAMYGEPKDVLRFRSFGCKAFVYLNKDRWQNGKHSARAVEGVNLGFVENTRAYLLYILERKKLMSSNQVRFDETEFPFRKAAMVEQYLSDNSTDILLQSASEVAWVPYNKFHVGDYEKAHYDKVSDVVVFKVNSKENTYTRAIMYKWTIGKYER